MTIRLWTDQELKEAITESTTLSEVVQKIKDKYSITISYASIKKYAIHLSISIEHLIYKKCTENPKWIKAKKKTDEYHHNKLKDNELQYNKNPKLCKKCKKIIPYKKRFYDFCSHSCAASFNNIGNNKWIKITGEKEIRSCLNCLKPVIEPKKFCNSKCCGQYVKKETFKNIKNNNLENISDPRVKEFLIKKYGVKCQICNTSEWLGRPIPLVLDHIDGDHENRDIKNYRLVCGNCDMLLPTYKGKNKGHGRFSRRERYKQGKSY
jgi:hypothetical protein